MGEYGSQGVTRRRRSYSSHRFLFFAGRNNLHVAASSLAYDPKRSNPSTWKPSMNDVDDQLRELLPRLRRFAVSLTRDYSSADDLVQASLEKALSAWPGRRPEGDLRAWLFSILYRQFVDNHRRSRRYSRMLELFTGASGEDQHEPSVERTVVARTTLQAFERLNPEQRALLLWVSVEGLSYKEVAGILEVPVGTVMSRLSRARQALRQLSEGEITTPALRILK
jgi:RNA polymerase sigma-70 factor (ECF subfamily)